MQIQQDILIGQIEDLLSKTKLSDLKEEKLKIWNYLIKLKSLIEFKEKFDKNGQN